MEYQLVNADNIELCSGQVKATYLDKNAAIQALFTEIRLAKAELDIDDARFRTVETENGVAVDYGCWSNFIGLTGVRLFDLFGEA